MSRSLGNVLDCKTIANAAGAEAMRMFVVGHHYRSPATFEVVQMDKRTVFRDLEACDRRLDYFYSTLQRLDRYLAGVAPEKDSAGEVVPEAHDLVSKAHEGLQDDFNTAVVLAALSDAARAANKLLDEPKSVPKPVRKRSLRKLERDIRNVAQGALGILKQSPKTFLHQRRTRLALRQSVDLKVVEQLLEQRLSARKERDFSKADQLRQELHQMGIEVQDTPEGVDWKIAE